MLGGRGRVFAVYAVLLVATALVFQWVPRGFIPLQDKLYLIAGVKLPEGASIERTDAALKKSGRDRDEHGGRAERGRIPRPEPAAVHQYAQQRRGVLPLEAVRSAPPERRADQRRDQPEDRRHPGGLRLLADAAADPGPRQRLGLLALHRGPRQSRLRRAAERRRRLPGRGFADAGHGLPDHELPGQRAAARRRRGPGQGQGAGRAADGTVRHAADLPGLGLRQRLQPVRPHLAGDRPGRRPVPRQRRGHRQPAHPQRSR